MALYNNQQRNALISAVEFTPVAEGNFSFFYIDSPLKKDNAKNWIVSNGQEIIAETPVNGHIVFVTHGDKSWHELLDMMAKQDQRFVQAAHKRKFDPWVTRSLLGFTGQSLQFISSTMGKNGVSWDKALFALSNIAANTISFIYGAQKSEDIHRLRFLKEKFNADLSQDLPPGQALPDVNENRLALHNGKPHELGTTVHKFLERNSVRVGELALRYIGAVMLMFPTYGLRRGFQEYQKSGSIRTIFAEAKNRDKWAYNIGLASAVGKTIALFSKEADPYNPKPHTTLDTIREKVTFPLGGFIESIAFGAMTYDHFAHPKIQFRGKLRRDYLGGIGSAMFVTAYIIRSGWAKFGERDVNMDELYAHVSDSLAHLPPEKLPQLMAETAASIKMHFKDKPIDFGEIFTRLMTDAYRYHHLALDNTQEAVPVQQADTTHSTIAKRTLIPPKLQPMDRVDPATVSHTDKISTEIKAQPGIGA